MHANHQCLDDLAGAGIPMADGVTMRPGIKRSAVKRPAAVIEVRFFS
jgi:hypothetical protein